jgi:hypothetical protein
LLPSTRSTSRGPCTRVLQAMNQRTQHPNANIDPHIISLSLRRFLPLRRWHLERFLLERLLHLPHCSQGVGTACISL